MKTEFFLAQRPLSLGALELRHIYHVEADRSYDTPRSGKFSGWIIVRTLKGRGMFYLHGGHSLSVGENSLCLLANSEIERYRWERDCWDFWWICFDVSGAFFLQAEYPYSLRISAEEERLLSTLLGHKPEVSSFWENPAGEGFLRLLFYWKDALFPSPKLDPRIALSLRVLRENPSRDYSVAELSGLAGLSERRFRELFRRETGLNPQEYLNRQRLERAEWYLRHSTLTVRECAFASGFANEYYFSRLFRRRRGISPGRWRAAVEESAD